MPQYPSISEILDPSAISGEITVLNDAIDQVLAKLRFRDLIVETSPENDGKFYSLTLITRELAIDLLGSGLKLIFFPAADETAPESEFSVAFEYRWAILRYVPEFETLSFAGTGKAFFDIFLELVDITEVRFLTGIVECFINEPAPYQALIDKLKQWPGGPPSLQSLTLDNPPVGFTEIENIVQQMTAANIDVFQAAFEAVIEDLNDLDGSIDRLANLFQLWLGDISRDDIEALLLPQFSVGLQQIAMAIEVPRSVLVPIDSNNLEISDTAHSRLTFTAGGVRYDSKTGFAIDIDTGLDVEFTRSMVPGFGLTLDFDDIKIDLSRTTNIAEADADGRPADFMGVYVGNAVVGLPAKWFDKYQPFSGPPVTLGIVGRHLIFGTGGFSGTIGLEVLTLGAPDKTTINKATGPAELEFVFGKQPTSGARKGFKLGFSTFDMKFRQNVLLESTIKGSLTIPKLQADPIHIELYLSHDGDFKVTASTPNGHDFIFPDVFTFKAREVNVGKNDKKVFLQLKGELIFDSQSVLGKLIKKPIHLEKLLIHSDGSMELEGGDFPLPESVVLPIGPAKIAITAIHFGAHQQDHLGVMREYRYFGLDAAVSVDPGRCGGKGDGIKFYYTVDNDPNANPPRAKHHFLRIEGLGICLFIPGNASEGEAALVLKGYLALKDPVYEGSISFKLLKGLVVGGASMKYDTSYPAWLVDANLELPKAIPLGSTSLALYSFRGLFGLRYVAAKEAIVPPLAPDASWGDYYRAKQDIKGVTYKKFITPDATGGSGNPFSVGVGVGLETQADDGKTFSAQLFLLVSLPNLVMLEGRADILSKHRVAADDDPPYYAYLALSPESVELGVGVNYLIPKDSGTVLNLNAVLEAAFFFHNASAWYIHFGTKAKPVTARILSMFDGYSYLMLSASGMEMGAGVHFDFNKNYGPVRVAAHAYLDTWAYIAFERFQAGGGIALGGHVDVQVFKLGFYIELAALLTVEVPKPFYVAGSVEICVTVNLKVKKFHKCCQLDFKWEKDQTVDRTPVPVMTVLAGSPAAVAMHMVSGSTYPVEFSSDANPVLDMLIPLDAYIDVKFTKPVDPSKVADRIGGYTSPPNGQAEVMPPKYGSRIVHHAYSLDDVRIDVRDSALNWVPYHPYKALAQEAVLDAQTLTQLDTMPLGVWQKQDPGYSQIRFLALTPFSWMGAATGFCPEEMGVTAKSTYCVARERQERCLVWSAPETFTPGVDHYREGVLYRVDGDRVEAVNLSQTGLQPVSLAIAPSGRASFRFLERAVRCQLTVFTTAPSITARWQRRKTMPDQIAGDGTVVFGSWAPTDFEDIGPPVIILKSAFVATILYDDPGNPVDRLVLETPGPDAVAIALLEDQIALSKEDWVRADARQRRVIAATIANLNSQLMAEHDRICATGFGTAGEIAALTAERDSLGKQIEGKQKTYDTSCSGLPAPAPAASASGTSSKPQMSDSDCSKLAAEIAALKDRMASLQSQIAALRRQAAGGDANRLPPDWKCGTFVHSVCWLSLADHTYNETIPGIAAIEADYSTMRSALEGTIAPVWKPRSTFRITLTASDAVTDENDDTPSPVVQNFYIHFRTGGPIGHFTGIQTSPLMTPPPNPNAAPPLIPDDGRPEAPERALKFYIDEKSYPDPSGNLLYAKPLYYRDVILRLFFSNPHAYHFFANWPDVDAGARAYALELAVKDPAEAEPLPSTVQPPLNHEAQHVSAPLLGAQTWIVDPNPRLAAEIKTIRNFQDPLQNGADSGAVCLTTGGAPITPLSKALQVEMGDLDPSKLYTAVVLNRSLDEGIAAEVARIPFKTSIYPDFVSHIASYKLKDDAQNERLAVFALDHDLAPAFDEATVLAAALAIIDSTPSTDTLAYTDSFDRLLYSQLRLASPAPATSLEFNFVTNTITQLTYGMWLRSPEALIDPRVPKLLLDDAIRLFVSNIARDDAHVLFSKDRCQAFVMVSNGAFPTTDVAVGFTSQSWNGNAYVAQTAASDSFAKP